MIDRILDLSEEPARLKVQMEQLIIERKDQPQISVPLADLGVLVVSHSAVVYTHAVLTGIIARGGALVLCGDRHLPVGMIYPLDEHYIQTERFIKQTELSLPCKKQLWRQVVMAKIKAQGLVLKELRGEDFGLANMAKRVKSGDAGNLEAQASRRYWPILFEDPQFRRDRYGGGPNPMLNYGYAVLRAVTARAVCAAGLHPSLGLHHHNRYNAFCLADDLMEPFRPIVDRAVARWVDKGNSGSVDKLSKTILLETLTKRYMIEEESRTLFDVITRTTQSLAAVCEGRRKSLSLPEIG